MERSGGARIVLRFDLDDDEAALLLRNVPDGETPETAARWWLLKILGDFEESILPLAGEPDPDPRRGFRLIPGGRSEPARPDPLPPVA